MNVLLVIDSAESAAAGRAAALRSAGVGEVAVGNCLTLVQQVADLAPQQVVCDLSEGDAGIWDALAAWGGAPPCAIGVVAPWADACGTQAFVEAGVSAWAAAWPPNGALPAWLALGRARHGREAALRAELARAREMLDDRKWVDRAKGLLMTARSLPEDDAFKLLRDAAMQANLKLGDVSRSVIDAARWAEAVNRAGQLRMLSQRLVAMAAQRYAKVDPLRAKKQQERAAQRVQDNLDHLVTLGLQAGAGDALAHARACWAALDMALAQRLSDTGLAACDARAEDLLQAADALTSVLEASGARRALAVVNRCGSLRMRAQRVAKEALLANLLSEPARLAQLQRTMTEFEEVLGEIAAAPLSSPEIRSALDGSREGWMALLRALRVADASLLVGSSESLLDHLDRLTECCERSLQVLLS